MLTVDQDTSGDADGLNIVAFALKTNVVNNDYEPQAYVESTVVRQCCSL